MRTNAPRIDLGNSTSTVMRLIILSILVLLPLFVHAQENLPDLTPTEFEITGELEISLPNLERQPLSGFGPPPRVANVDHDATVLAYNPSFYGVPVLRLPAPLAPEFSLADSRLLRAEGGFGIDVARYGRFDLSLDNAFVDFDYNGLGNTVELGSPETPESFVTFSSFDLEGGVHTTDGIQAGATGWFRRNEYSMPGVSATLANRTSMTLGAEGTVGTSVGSSVPALLRMGISQSRLENEFDDPACEGCDELEPTSLLAFSADGQAEFLNRLIRVEAGAGTSDIADNETGRDIFDYNTGLVVQGHFDGGAEITVGARVLGYETSFTNGDASSSLFAPVGSFSLPIGTSARLYAATDPHVERQSVWTQAEANPFVSPMFIAPNVHTVDGEGGLELRSNHIGFRAFGGVRISPTLGVFERNPTSGLYDVAYAEARTVEGGVDVTILGPAGIEFSAGGSFRDGMLTEFDESIPYFASTIGRLGLQIPFMEGKGRIGGAAYFEGERPIDRSGSIMAPAFGRLTLDGAYTFWNGVSIVIRGERLLGRAEQWQGYPQASYSVMGGIRFVR